MTTTVTISFTATPGQVVLNGSRFFGPPAELAKGDFQGREPIAWAAAQEFLRNGVEAGVVTVTAV